MELRRSPLKASGSHFIARWTWNIGGLGTWDIGGLGTSAFTWMAAGLVVRIWYEIVWGVRPGFDKVFASRRGQPQSRGVMRACALSSWGPTTERMPRLISPKLLALSSLARQLQRDTSMSARQGSAVTHVTQGNQLPIQPAIAKARRLVLGKEP